MHGLRHGATMLVSHNLLHRISELGEAPDLLRGVGLPKGCRTALLEAASGSLTEKNIIPCVVPPKWVRTLSRSTGLQFVQSNVVTSNSGLVDVWRGKTNQRFYRRRHNTVISAHCGLRDLQNLSTSCFAINLVGLALALAGASTLLTSVSCVWGLSKVTSSWMPASWIRHLSVHLSPNISQSSAGTKPGQAVYVEHSITSDFICVLRNTGGRVHLLSKIHKAPVVQWRSVA